jgi:hypothetical protein
MTRNFPKFLASFAATLAITACGGGGGGGTADINAPSNSIDAAAVGVYKATVSGGTSPIFQSLIVGPTGKSAIYYEDGFGSSRGFVDATVSGSGGNFTASLTDYARSGIFNGSASGTYRSGSGIAATVIYPGQSTNIEFTFDYQPTLASGPTAAVGSWNSIDERGTAQSVIIAGARTGTITITYGTQCMVTGSTSFGDNSNTLQLATINATSSGGGCRFGNGPMTGLLLVKSPNTTKPSIIGHLVRQDRTDGFMFQSFRCPDGTSRTFFPLLVC